MELKSTDLVSLFEDALAKSKIREIEETGIVIQVADFTCRIYGLKNAMYGELVSFSGGNSGILLNLEEDFVTAFLLNASIPVEELETVSRKGNVFKLPVSKNFLGRVVNARGEEIDGLGDIETEEKREIEAEIPGILDRSPVSESLETGILAVDALVPIGKGQRELIIGNRSTGKTSLAIDAIINQRDKNVICVYVGIGQRSSNLARTTHFLKENGAMDYTIVVATDASQPVINRYLAPYSGCTIAEYFRDMGHDVLIVYDDLSNHGFAYREMSLLMRRSPGREAYPGDIFYLHSRLLERAGKLLNGGTITALPIVQIQSDDITSYIPTNLISITDGQIFLDTNLFNSGIRPAVNVELSVSRVGGAAQKKIIKQMTKALRLEIAQYQELAAFAQFGTELDFTSQKKLRRGEIIINMLKQPQFVTYSFVDQALMLFLLQKNYLEDIDISEVNQRVTQFASYTKSVYPETYKKIQESEETSEEITRELSSIASEFMKVFKKSGE